jgi:hypothetical protein
MRTMVITVGWVGTALACLVLGAVVGAVALIMKQQANDDVEAAEE